MPMTVRFHDKAIKTLVSPPSPVPPLRDIIMSIRKSTQINALAQMGRDILRSCVIARKYKNSIEVDFLESIDNELNDFKLSLVAERSALLERLKVHEVASDVGDKAHILLAYLGAVFMTTFKELGSNSVHESINDICFMVLEPGDPRVEENNSHEKMTRIPGVARMPTPVTTRTSSPVKSEYPSRALTSTAPSEGTRFDFDDGMGVDSFSSGPGPVHTASPISLAAPQPQYHISPAPPQLQPPHMQPPQTQPQPLPQGQPQATFAAQPPLGGMPPGYITGMHPNAGGFSNVPQAPPAPPGPPAPTSAVVPPQSQGYISLINEMAMKYRKSITWQTTKTGAQHMPEWTMWLYVDNQPKGQGTATTKQAAKELASKNALFNLGWAQV